MTKSILYWQTSILFIVLILTCSPLMAGVVFQLETTHHSGSGARKTQSSQMSVEKPNLKMEILPEKDALSEEVQGDMVFRGDRRQMLAVDHKSRSYMVIDEAGVRAMSDQMRARMGGQTGGAMGDQMQQAMRELDEKLKGLDPRQREMIERMLKGRMGSMGGPPATPKRPQLAYRQTHERATKQNYPCTKYEVWRDGEKIRELWVTAWQNIRYGKEVRSVFKEMSAFHRDLMAALQDVAGPGAGFFDSDRNPMESFSRVDGFPVVTRSFEGGELESETVLESVTERDLDPDAFEPPNGYRLRTMGPQ
jgi:hypothetical protein